MSPEQTLADPLELDTRSDVYTLGVMLYEVLAGKLPYSLSNKPGC
jgi:eukaryotic-like serine/threonine-protein kinase